MVQQYVGKLHNLNFNILFNHFSIFLGQALEGFLIPTMQRIESPSEDNDSFFEILVPTSRSIITFVVKIIKVFVIGILPFFFFGTLICVLSPVSYLCSSSLRKETKEIVDKIKEEVTPENIKKIKRAADLLSIAISKYSA